MYCVVGQCDPNEDHSEISDKIDDYLWLKLSQLEFGADSASQEALPLERSQKVTSQETLTLERFQKLLYEDYGNFCLFVLIHGKRWLCIFP